MNWRLDVFPPNTDENFLGPLSSSQKAIYTNEEPGGIVGGFEWDIAGNGNCLQLRFDGSRFDPFSQTERLNIGPRDIVKLYHVTGVGSEVDALFTGIVTTCAAPKDSSVQTYVAEGFRRLFAEKVMDERRPLIASDLRTILSIWFSEYDDGVKEYPSLLPAPVSFIIPALTGYELSDFSAPFIRLDEALDLLAEAAPGYSWGVNANGSFFFTDEPFDPDTWDLRSSENVLAETLPIRSETLVTKVNLIVQSEAGRAFGYDIGTPDTITVSGPDDPTTDDYDPIPIVHPVEHAQHNSYGAEVARLIPEIDPFIGVTATAITSTGLSNPGNATDGSDSTYAHNNGSSSRCSIRSGTHSYFQPYYGLEATYRCLSGGVKLIIRRWDNSASEYVDYFYVTTPSGSSTLHTERFVIPRSAHAPTGSEPDRLAFEVLAYGLDAADDFRLYDFKIMALDEDTLDNIGTSLFVLPAEQPTRLTVEGYLSPRSNVQFTGVWGDEYTLPVSQSGYKVTTEDGEQTIFQLEQPDEDELVQVVANKAAGEARKASDRLRVSR